MDKPLWEVKQDPNAMAESVANIAAMVTTYYWEVLKRTENNQLALALTLEFQRVLLQAKPQ